MGRPCLRNPLIRASRAGVLEEQYPAVDIGLLVLRAGTGSLLIALHGWTRLRRAYLHVVQGEQWSFVSYLESMGFPFPTAFGTASALAESAAAFLLIVGLLSRPAAAVIAGNFAVATVTEVMGGDPFGYPAMYLLTAMVVVIAGPGSVSVDAWHRRRRRSRQEGGVGDDRQGSPSARRMSSSA